MMALVAKAMSLSQRDKLNVWTQEANFHRNITKQTSVVLVHEKANKQKKQKPNLSLTLTLSLPPLNLMLITPPKRKAALMPLLC